MAGGWRWAATARAACWRPSSPRWRKEKGGLKLAYQLLLFPNTQIGGDTSSLNEFAVGYFLERRTIEYFNSLYLPPGVDKNRREYLAACAPGISPACRPPM